MSPRTPAILVLKDGTVFRGTYIGADGLSAGEVVFNTAMTGYQEILTDPSYARQIVTLTYPHIGNTGANAEDVESGKVYAAGLVIRDLPLRSSNFRESWNLSDYLKRENVVAIADIDTRKLTRILREKGAQEGCIMAGQVDEAAALRAAREFPGLAGMDLAKVVSTRQPYEWAEGEWSLAAGYAKAGDLARVSEDGADFVVRTGWNATRLRTRSGARFDLFAALDATDEQLDFPILYGSAKQGWMAEKLEGPQDQGMTPLFELVLRHVPPPSVEEGPFRLLGTIMEANPYLGRLITGRITSGSVKPNQSVKVLDHTGKLIENGRIVAPARNMRFNQRLGELFARLIAIGPTERTWRAAGDGAPAAPPIMVENFNFSSKSSGI